MTIHNTEFRTAFDMETDTGELFDVLESKAQAAFMDVFKSDSSFDYDEPKKFKPRWVKDDYADYD